MHVLQLTSMSNKSKNINVGFFQVTRTVLPFVLKKPFKTETGCVSIIFQEFSYVPGTRCCILILHSVIEIEFDFICQIVCVSFNNPQLMDEIRDG